MPPGRPRSAAARPAPISKPAGGVGINLAIQDAVAAANILGLEAFRGDGPTPRELRKVQRRRQASRRA